MVLTLSLLITSLAFAQAQAPRVPVERSPCERLAGVERERCIAEEKAMRERLGRSDEQRPKKCDELFGPEKEVCLKRGGTVKTGTPRDAR